MNDLKKLLKRLSSYNFTIQQNSLYSYGLGEEKDPMPRRLDFEDLGSMFSYKTPRDTYTDEVSVANFNFARIVILFKIMSEINTNNTQNTKNQGVNVKFQTLCETIIILLVDTLEVYLSDLFEFLASKIKVRELNVEKVEKFFEKTSSFLKKPKKPTIENYDGTLWGLIIKQKEEKKKDNKLYFNFQNREICLISFSTIELDLIDIDKANFEKIYQKPHGIVQKRHDYAHGKSTIFSLKRLETEKFSVRTIRKYILIIARFIYNMENTRLCKYEKLTGLTWSTTKIKFKDGKPTNLKELPDDVKFL